MSSPDPSRGAEAGAEPVEAELVEVELVEAESGESAAPSLWDQMGGPMGLVDSGLPVVVFVVVNALTSLGWAIGAALACGVLVAAARLARRKPVTQAIGGLFAVGVAAFIAHRTGSAKGFFLVGIWLNLVYAAILLASVLVRWPLVGVLWEFVNGRSAQWRRNRRLLHLFDAATLVWVVVSVVRFAVQQWLYGKDAVGWLATAKLLLGYPLTVVAAVVTILIVGSAAGMSLPGWMGGRTRQTGEREPNGVVDPE